MKSVNAFDIAVVFAYFLVMLSIGLYFVRVNKGGRDYFTGGGMVPWWMSGISLYMGNFSAWIFTGAAGFAYSTGLFTLLYFSIGAFAYVFGTKLNAVRWRRTRSISPMEYTYTRFNIPTQQFLSWVIATNFTLSGGVQLASTCKLIAPVIGFDISVTALLIGSVILVYTFLGGMWADSVMDVVQGSILLSIVFLVMPLSLALVGGPGALLDKLPPLTFDHTYNGVQYNEHWLLAIFVITCIGFASHGRQFYSVKDEKSARRVGYFAALLALSVPLFFGIPPLVASIHWPDLSQVEFFRPYIDKNPQDLVFIGLVLELLPHGLIGIFIAAMLGATMTTLSSVFNYVSSIYTRDIYQGLFGTRLSDEAMLKTGRRASLVVGGTVIGLALIFVNSQFGIFNLMQTFFTLLNIPVTVPLAFGLVNRRIPRWSAIGAITWGLIAGVTARFGLGWNIGPQVYLSFIMTISIFMSARYTADLYKHNKKLLALSCLGVCAVTGALFFNTAIDGAIWRQVVSVVSSVALGGSLFAFARLFSLQSEEDTRIVAEFFRRVDTPIDVASEVYGAGKKQVSTMPLIGKAVVIMSSLISLVLFTGLSLDEMLKVIALVGVLLTFGSLMWFFGKRTERKYLEERASSVGSGFTPHGPAESGLPLPQSKEHL